MATKCKLLVVAALAVSALAANDDPASLVAAKEVAEAFGEALKEEQPLLKNAELHKSTVMASKDDLVAALANPGGWASQFERDVTDLVIGLSKGGFGATPFGDSVKKISDIIQKEMMPTVIEFHEKDQGTLNELSAAVHECGAVKKKELDAALKLKLKYTTTSKDHKKCRGEEAALYSENVECHAEWLARKKEKELKCKAYSVVTKRYGDSNANKNIVNKAGSEDVETYVRRITTTVCGNRIICPTCKNGGGGGPSGIGGGMLDDLLKHKKLCEVATHRYNVQTTKCNLLDKKWHDKRKSCNSLQDTMDASSCKWAIDTKDACESYAECYKATVQAYEDAKCSEWSGKKFPKTINCTKGVEADEKQRHPEFKGLKRMDCIIQAFGGSGGITMKDILACKAKTHYTNNSKLGVDLVIKYPGYPDLVPCVVPLLYPNTAEYKAAEFTPLPTLAKGKFGANECTGVREVSTTPATGSPASCKCERVTMNGPYSPGAVVKCVNCLDVSKSTQKTSCPTGTKLFSPQTRQDWDSFLKSAKPLRAPHWIIDVTRPQNGCGGCTSYTMNSQTTQQQSWVTNDNSPWWLRSTRYNEPNGDYNANCYLDLWQTPANSNSVTWNDGRCNYHSKSYYCQVVKFSLAPKTGSPKGCTCKKVELNGKYSARFLLKCDNCLDVRRSKDKNSCPSGTKLFSPTSREDWKTFIKSATQLRAPHWIIDITRPTNGCGGCTKNAMHSGNAAQGTWKTADGSPWWLRSTTYNEPNGDYHANCYLDLWHNPPNENSVTWNDGNCNYHAKSYYCQTVGGKSKKVTSTLPPWKRAEKWKLVMRISGGDTFGYSSSYWTNDKLLNENEPDDAGPHHCTEGAGGKCISCTYGVGQCKNWNTGHNKEFTKTYAGFQKFCKSWSANKGVFNGGRGDCKAFDAKYPAFTKVPFSKIKMCIGSKDKNCVEHKFTRDYANAKALFAAGYLRDKTVDQKGILKAFGPAKDSYQSCPMQRPGFNIQCNDGNKARWGYCTNCQSQPCQNADSNDADASIGIGLAGQSTPRQMGAGWTNYFASGKGTCSANSMTEKKVWFYVYENTML